MKKRILALIIILSIFACVSVPKAGYIEVSKDFAVVHAKMGKKVLVVLPWKPDYQLIDYVDDKLILLDNNGNQLTEDSIDAELMKQAKYFVKK